MLLAKVGRNGYNGVEYEDYCKWCIEKDVKGRGRDLLEGMFIEFT
jgi:hypothetical protein